MLVSHTWLKEYLGDSIPSPEKIEELLTFHSFEIEEITKKEGDTVIDVDILPNRSSDCLCHRGIAREIATLTGTSLETDPLGRSVNLPTTDKIIVDIQDQKICPRFTAVLIEGIEVKESPQWLQDRLRAIGQRPINNIVDATNYVMFSLGQPMHAYDADKFPNIDGVWQFEVRTAKSGETISLLGEGASETVREMELIGTETLVVDKSNGTPISLAGIKGGSFAEVDSNTQRIIVESAHWHSIITRKTARRLGFVIESSKRNENEPARDLSPYAQVEVVELITKIAGGTCTGYVDVYPEKIESPHVTVSPQRANALLGSTLSVDEMVSILTRAGVQVEIQDKNIICIGPWERTDLNIEEDFIEEIGRIYGYEHVVSVVPKSVPLTEYNARHYYSEKVREALVSLGFSEVITSSFRKKDELQLQNALASDKSYLRSSLQKNIVEVLDKNVAHTDLLGHNDTRVFEIGTVFSKGESGIAEHISLCFGVRIKQSGYSGKEDKILTDVITQLEAVLGTQLKATTQKGVVETNFTDVFTKAPAPTAYDPVEVAQEIAYKPFSLYPSMSRDIALWVEEGTTVSGVEQILNEHAGDLRVRTTLFDEFTKDGRISYAFRLVFQASNRTLTDEEVNTIMEQIYVVLQEKKWEVR